MLITHELDWQGKDWPAPYVRVIGPGADDGRVAKTVPDSGWVVFKILTPSIRNVTLLQQVLVKLWSHRQLGFGPLLYSRDKMTGKAVQDLLETLSEDPNSVVLKTDAGTGDILHLAVGANLLENPHFGNFFRNLTHTDSLPPDFLADQMRRYLVVARPDEAQP